MAAAMRTTLRLHFGKEEEQLLPLLEEHFTHYEQSGLVWQARRVGGEEERGRGWIGPP